MAIKQAAAPAFPFPVLVSENTANQLAAPGAIMVDQTSPPNINLTLTGQSSTTAVGTPTIQGSAAVTLTGVASTSAVGTPTIEGDDSLTLTGVASTTAVGTPVVEGDDSLTLTGVVATSAVGTPTVNIEVDCVVTGVASTSAIGTPTVEDDDSLTLSGVASTTAAGTLVASLPANATVTGVAATAAVGNPMATETLVGVFATAAVGILAVSQTALTGVETDSALGTIGLAITTNPPIVGVQATTATDPAVQAGPEPTLVGQAATSAAGTLSVFISDIDGVQATTGIGTLTTMQGLRTLTGQQIAGSVPAILNVTTGTNFTNATIVGVGTTSQTGVFGAQQTAVMTLGGVGTMSAVPPGLTTATSAISDVGMTISDLNVLQTTGPEPDLGLTIRWSDTEGASWSDSVIKSLGFAGNYLNSIQVRRMGMSRHGRVFELSWSAAVPTALVGATVRFEDAGS